MLIFKGCYFRDLTEAFDYMYENLEKRIALIFDGVL